MREHPETFQAGNLITLEGPSGNTWRVRATDKPIIHSGWRAFAHDHDLREGDHLCFNLTHPSHFVVEVLDGNGEVKGTALNATNTGKYIVASISNPCEYVRRSRKRKSTTSPTMKKTPRRSRDRFGYGVHDPTIASRCKTTARRRSSNDYPLGVRLQFSHQTKQWECREDVDGREVVTILDSDDEADGNRLLDHIGVSFGSAQVQNYRMSRMQRLVDYMKAQGEDAPRWSIPRPPAPLVAMSGEDHRMVAPAGDRRERITHQEIAGHSGETVAEANTAFTASHRVNVEAGTEKLLDSGIDPEARGACNQVMTMNNEAETHLKVNVQPGNSLESIYGAVAEHESHVTLGLLPMTTDLPVNPSQELRLTSTAAISEKTQAEVGEFLFATLQNIVDVPAIADTTNGQNRDSGHPLIRDLIIQDLAHKKYLNLQMEDEPHVNKLSKDSEYDDGVLQSSSKVHKSSAVFPVTHLQPSYGYGNNASLSTQEDELTTEQYLHFLQPPKATVGHPRRQLEFKQFLNNIVVDSDLRNIPCTPNAYEKSVVQAARKPPLVLSVNNRNSTETCVLRSKRGPVAKLDREKTLRAAHAWTKKLRNANFVAVMQTSNVYHDFIVVSKAHRFHACGPSMLKSASDHS